MGSLWAAAALGVALSCTATAQVAVLQVQVIDGEGGVRAPGSRSARPLTVEITDERGRPVAGAAVSFHLPEDGPSGVFPNGLRTDVVTTDERGRATLRAIEWNRNPGRFQIRIIASKEQSRAGIVSFQNIAGTGSAAASPRSEPAQAVSHHRGKWIAALALVGGGVAAGVFATRGGRGVAPTTTPIGAVGTTPILTIGPPSITVGKP